MKSAKNVEDKFTAFVNLFVFVVAPLLRDRGGETGA